MLRGELTLTPSLTADLAKTDLVRRKHHLRLWQTLGEVQSRLAGFGVGAAIAKGITAEHRWYSRSGERPCNDLDLVLCPSSVERVDEVVRVLQPRHPLASTLRQLMGDGVLQSIDLDVGGVEVDLHADLLKFEVPTRRPGVLFEAAVPVTGTGGVAALAPSPEHSLVHFALHLNKDNFARLLAYADIARILATEDVDWTLVESLAAGEGLRVHVYSALHDGRSPES